MIILPEKQKGRIEHFFPEDLPSKVWLDAYFQDRVPGIAYVDNLVTPTFSIVVTEFYHFTFIGWSGHPRDFTLELTEVLSNEVYLEVIWKRENGITYPLENFIRKNARFEFGAFVSKSTSIEHLNIVKDDIVFEEINGTNFYECESKGQCLIAYETKSRFLKECFGILARRNGNFLGDAEAICQSVDKKGESRADIQITVADNFRRKGIGRRLSENLIVEMSKKGIRPIWTCNQDNEASVKLAKSLGFINPIEFDMLSYGIQPGLQKYWCRILYDLGTSQENIPEIVLKLQNEFQFNRMDAHWLVVTYLRELEK